MCVTSDSAANMLKLARLFNAKSQRCLVHMIHSAITRSVLHVKEAEIKVNDFDFKSDDEDSVKSLL